MTVAKLRPSTHDRLSYLEERAKVHDTMADQVKEMYELLTKAKTIIGALNWFWVKIIGGCFAALGALAVVSTIWVNFGRLLHGG